MRRYSFIHIIISYASILEIVLPGDTSISFICQSVGAGVSSLYIHAYLLCMSICACECTCQLVCEFVYILSRNEDGACVIASRCRVWDCCSLLLLGVLRLYLSDSVCTCSAYVITLWLNGFTSLILSKFNW